MEVALCGLGEWGRSRWLPPLSEAMTDSPEDLWLLDLSPQLPVGIQPSDHPYLPWSRQLELPQLDVAVVAVNAQAHRDVVVALAQLNTPPGVIVCEKPAGDSRDEFLEMMNACNERGIRLLVADHYLLRPSFQDALQSGEFSASQETMTSIHGYLLEKSTTGPAQGAHTDMLVHLVNIIRMLLPTARFQIKEAQFEQITKNPYADVTHVLISGILTYESQTAKLHLEVGKHRPRDRKEIILASSNAMAHLNLSSGKDWSYDRLIRLLRSDQESTHANLLQLGALAASFMDDTWRILQDVSQRAGYRRSLSR